MYVRVQHFSHTSVFYILSEGRRGVAIVDELRIKRTSSTQSTLIYTSRAHTLFTHTHTIRQPTVDVCSQERHTHSLGATLGAIRSDAMMRSISRQRAGCEASAIVAAVSMAFDWQQQSCTHRSVDQRRTNVRGAESHLQVRADGRNSPAPP